MPVTPFHAGFGMLLNATAPRRFSFLIFCGTQVAIDFESGYDLLRGEWPAHRVLHTFLGATLLCVPLSLILRNVIPRVLTIIRKFDGRRAGYVASAIPWSTALVSGIGGVFGHVVPDGIMHSDIRPFQSFTELNELYEAVSLGALHLALIAMGDMRPNAFAISTRSSIESWRTYWH